MSNETETAEKELKEMEEQITQAAETEREKAVPEEPAPSPEPVVSSAPEPSTEPETPVTPQSQVEAPKDDPLKWAEKKGFKTPEDMARALLQKEQEFHQSRQKKAQGEPEFSPPPPAWNPQPQYGGYPPPAAYGYPPAPPTPSRSDLTQRLARENNLDPDDVERLMPLIFKVADVVSDQKSRAMEAQMADVRRQSERQNELMRLMQDPAFRDERVQREINAVLDADPTIYQRERFPNTEAFNQALGNLARKQLQQGVAPVSSPSNMPPVTAGGGNGSASSGPIRVTQKMFDSWDIKDQEKFLNSNGRILPKK